MPSITINFGRILILIGAIGYIYGLTTAYASPTALIPAVFGLILLVLGYVARAKEDLRKHLIHAAVVVALLGFLASAGRLVMKIGEFQLSAAYLSQVAMALTCLIFIIISVRSFMNARNNG
ncbi:MAG: hypothetical protein ACR2J3_09740 [Aridibacter sp.]